MTFLFFIMSFFFLYFFIFLFYYTPSFLYQRIWIGLEITTASSVTPSVYQWTRNNRSQSGPGQPLISTAGFNGYSKFYTGASSFTDYPSEFKNKGYLQKDGGWEMITEKANPVLINNGFSTSNSKYKTYDNVFYQGFSRPYVCVRDCPPPDACLSLPCQNDAICIAGINSYTCNCSGSGYTGVNCDINIDDCVANLCENGAICLDGINSYTCNCVTGFIGELCEINIDDCVANLCENGATCQDGINSYTCLCSAEYEGEFCQTTGRGCFFYILHFAFLLLINVFLYYFLFFMNHTT